MKMLRDGKLMKKCEKLPSFRGSNILGRCDNKKVQFFLINRLIYRKLIGGIFVFSSCEEPYDSDYQSQQFFVIDGIVGNLG